MDQRDVSESGAKESRDRQRTYQAGTFFLSVFFRFG